MRLLRLVPQRWQKLVHEALKFGTVGGLNPVINYAVFNALALTLFQNGQLKATVVAMIVATISAYFMNRHWTYSDRPKSAMHRETALFVLVNAAGLVIELGILGSPSTASTSTACSRSTSPRRSASGSRRSSGSGPTARSCSGPRRRPRRPSVPGQHEPIDAEALASFDPVAELAEVVSEYEASTTAHRR